MYWIILFELGNVPSIDNSKCEPGKNCRYAKLKFCTQCNECLLLFMTWYFKLNYSLSCADRHCHLYPSLQNPPSLRCCYVGSRWYTLSCWWCLQTLHCGGELVIFATRISPAGCTKVIPTISVLANQTDACSDQTGLWREADRGHMIIELHWRGKLDQGQSKVKSRLNKNPEIFNIKYFRVLRSIKITTIYIKLRYMYISAADKFRRGN